VVTFDCDINVVQDFVTAEEDPTLTPGAYTYRRSDSQSVGHNPNSQSPVSRQWGRLLSSMDIYDYRRRAARRARGCC